jgi:pimeloyl-ACP methyl ester carboxylesterase
MPEFTGRGFDSDPWKRFERVRLDVCMAHGLEGRSKRIPHGTGLETYAIVRGDGPCPAVLVHGGLGNAAEWGLIAGRLDGPLVMPDRPGCGLSYRIDYRQGDFRRDAAAWLLDLVDGLDVERIDLIGGSMGGFFAMAFATAHPERVRRLVLIGAPFGLYREAPLFLRLWGNPIVGRLISRMKISDAETLRTRAFAGLVVHPERIPSDLLEVYMAAAALPGTALASRTMLHAVMSLRGVRDSLLMLEDVTHLQVPTRFVWGDQDRLAPSSIGKSLAQRMGDGQITVIPDAGHMPQLDQPEAVAAVVNPFLRASDSP